MNARQEAERVLGENWMMGGTIKGEELLADPRLTTAIAAAIIDAYNSGLAEGIKRAQTPNLIDDQT